MKTFTSSFSLFIFYCFFTIIYPNHANATCTGHWNNIDIAPPVSGQALFAGTNNYYFCTTNSISYSIYGSGGSCTYQIGEDTFYNYKGYYRISFLLQKYTGSTWTVVGAYTTGSSTLGKSFVLNNTTIGAPHITSFGIYKWSVSVQYRALSSTIWATIANQSQIFNIIEAKPSDARFKINNTSYVSAPVKAVYLCTSVDWQWDPIFSTSPSALNNKYKLAIFESSSSGMTGLATYNPTTYTTGLPFTTSSYTINPTWFGTLSSAGSYRLVKLYVKNDCAETIYSYLIYVLPASPTVAIINYNFYASAEADALESTDPSFDNTIAASTSCSTPSSVGAAAIGLTGMSISNLSGAIDWYRLKIYEGTNTSVCGGTASPIYDNTVTTTSIPYQISFNSLGIGGVAPNYYFINRFTSGAYVGKVWKVEFTIGITGCTPSSLSRTAYFKITNGFRMALVASSEIENVELELYPNPATEVLNIRFAVEEEQSVSIKVLNMNGQSVLDILQNEILATGEYNQSISQIADLPAGIYMIQYSDGTKTQCKKFVKN